MWNFRLKSYIENELRWKFWYQKSNLMPDKKGRHFVVLPETQYLNPVGILRWIPVNSIFKDSIPLAFISVKLKKKSFGSFSEMAYSILAPSRLLERYALFVIENERKMFSVDASRCKNVRFKLIFFGKVPILVQTRKITLSSIEAWPTGVLQQNWHLLIPSLRGESISHVRFFIRCCFQCKIKVRRFSKL